MKYCEKCGENYESNLDVCPKCGGKLENKTQANNGIYNIRNPFLELQGAPSQINNNKENNTSITQGFGIQANTNNVVQPPPLNTIPTTNNKVLNNQIPNIQNSTNDGLNINEVAIEITHQKPPHLINEEKKETTQNTPNDGFLVFSNNNTTSKTTEEAKENLERLKKLNNPVLDFDPQKIKEEKEKSEKGAKQKEKENNKSPKYMSYIYIVLAAIMLFLTIIPVIYNFEVITLVHHLAIVVLLVVAYKLAPANKKVCSLTGLLTSVVMILTVLEKDYVTLSLGITLLIAEVFTYFVKDKKLKS